MKWSRNANSRSIATSSPIKSSASLASRLGRTVPAFCAARWYGMPKTSARSSCSPTCWSSAPPPSPAIYKERWQIELFFKALKQNLTVKTFVGTSENALRIQIWTALIALLLLKWLHHLSQPNWSLSNLASMLRLNLFTYRGLGPLD